MNSTDFSCVRLEDLFWPRFRSTDYQSSIPDVPNSEVDNIFKENMALRKQVELLSKNQSVRAQSIISDLLNSIDGNGMCITETIVRLI